MGFGFTVGSGPFGSSRLRKTVLRHFGVSAGEIATAGRQFPITARVDIQSALEDLLRNRTRTKLLGIVSPNRHEPPALAQILGGPFPLDGGPLEHEEIDVGEPVPVRCLKNGLWLSREKDLPFAIMMAPGGRFGLWTGSVRSNRRGKCGDECPLAGPPLSKSPDQSHCILRFRRLTNRRWHYQPRSHPRCGKNRRKLRTD